MFLEEGKRVGLDRLLLESSCRLLGRGWKVRIVGNVFDPEQAALSACSELPRREVRSLTALTACLSDGKPVGFVISLELHRHLQHRLEPSA